MQAIATFQVGYCAFADKGNGRKHHQGICPVPAQCWSRTTSQREDDTLPLAWSCVLPALSKWRGRTQGCFIRSRERWGLGYWITDLLKSEQRDFPGHPGIKMLPSKLGCLGQSLVGEQRSHVLPGNKTQATEPTCSCCNAVKLLHDATKLRPDPAKSVNLFFKKCTKTL